jgi:hypothetical protein
MDEVERGVPDQLLRSAAQDAPHRPAHVLEEPFRAHQRRDVRAVLDQGAEALLARAQGLLRPAAVLEQAQLPADGGEARAQLRLVGAARARVQLDDAQALVPGQHGDGGQGDHSALGGQGQARERGARGEVLDPQGLAGRGDPPHQARAHGEEHVAGQRLQLRGLYARRAPQAHAADRAHVVVPHPDRAQVPAVRGAQGLQERRRRLGQAGRFGEDAQGRVLRRLLALDAPALADVAHVDGVDLDAAVESGGDRELHRHLAAVRAQGDRLRPPVEPEVVHAGPAAQEPEAVRFAQPRGNDGLGGRASDHFGLPVPEGLLGRAVELADPALLVEDQDRVEGGVEEGGLPRAEGAQLGLELARLLLGVEAAPRPPAAVHEGGDALASVRAQHDELDARAG